jgi:opacity protein-like surface antigen
MTRPLSALLVATLLPMVALGQNVVDEPPGPSTTYETPTLGYVPPPVFQSVIGVLGVARFDRGLASIMEPGIGYGISYNYTPARIAAVELGYLGSVSSLSAAVASTAQLVTNQFSGVLRINAVPPDYQFPGDLKPFIFAGAAFQRVSTVNYTPGISGANAFAIPVGAGLEAVLGDRFLLGARFTYNFLFNVAVPFGGRPADDWLASVDLGARFPM